MSLIVCSNNSSEESISSSPQNIYKPYSFRNALSGNITVPKDAQISLQSAKVNMDGSILVGGENGRKIFYQYFGAPVDESGVRANSYVRVTQTVNRPVRVPLFDEKQERRITPRQIAIELQKSINDNLYNPNLHGRAVVTIKPDPSNADKFGGYTITYNQAPTGAFAPASIVPVAYSFAETHDRGMLEAYENDMRQYQLTNGAVGRAPEWTYAVAGGFGIFGFNGAGGSLRTRSAIGNVAPLHLKGGVYRVNINGCIGAGAEVGFARWFIGLGRPSRAKVGFGRENQIGPQFQHVLNSEAPTWIKAYCDYYVYMDEDNVASTTRRRIKIAHTVVNETSVDVPAKYRVPPFNRQPRPTKFVYAADTGTDANVIASANFTAEGYDIDTNSLNIDEIEFRANGQQIEIYLFDSVGATHYPLVTYDSTRNKDKNLKSLNQNDESLMPTVGINTRKSANGNHVLTIKTYQGNHANWSDFDFLDDNNCDFYSKRYTDPELQIQSKGLDISIPFRYSTLPNAPNPYVYGGVSDAASNSIFTLMTNALILTQANTSYGGHEGLLVSGANTELTLGFPNEGFVDDFTETTGNFAISSYVIPDILPSKSIFVRLENFTQESVNAFQGLQQSKIIAHLPRFDGVNQVGPLYLEPNNMVYLDLNNVEEFKLNSFDISLAYSDETYATSLVGTTIIVLHMRQKPK